MLSLTFGLSVHALFSFTCHLLQPNLLEVGQQLPIIGRETELVTLTEVIKGNMEVWNKLRSKKLEPSEGMANREYSQRFYKHIAVSGGPGRGKTTLMERGGVKVMRELFKDNWTGRVFSWNLVQSPLVNTECELIQRGHEGAQCVL